MKKILSVLFVAASIVACGGELDVEEGVDIQDGTAGFQPDDDDQSEDDPVDPPDDMEPDDSEPEVVEPSDVPNDGWIGGACESPADCEYDDSTCLADYPGGTCSQACDQFCPDRDGTNSITFCIEEDGAGACVSRCDYDLFPDVGCREGYKCQIRERFNDPSTQQGVCVPEDAENPDATTSCLRELDERGIIWAPWDYQTQTASNGAQCTIGDPIRVSSPVNGIDYRYYSQQTSSAMSMACELALALDDLGNVLEEHQIDTVLHIGTYNCRPISGTSRLSQHSYGMAIDIWGFEGVDGTRYVLEDHWEHDTENPQDPKARKLYDIGQAMHRERIFNIVLTPNYNAGHDNHFHVDLTAGGDFIGLHEWPEYWIGDDRPELCPQ